MSSPRRPLDSTGRGSGFIRGLSPAAWYRYGIGTTVTGSGVSQWSDQSGNARHLLQGTDANRPALQTDNSILFNGTAHFLKVAAWVQAQPITAYLLFKQVTWTSTDNVIGLNDATNCSIVQAGTTPELRVNSGVVLSNTNLPVDTYGIIAAVYNGASSVSQINNTTPVTGDAGANTANVITLGANGAASSAFGNIQVKEVILFGAAHSSAIQSRVIRYLSQVGNLWI